MDGFADRPLEVEDGAYPRDFVLPGATSGAEFRVCGINATSTPDAEGGLDTRGLAYTLLAEPRAQFVAADAVWRIKEVKK